MPIKAHEFDHLIAKFGFETKESHHKLAWLVHDGCVVVRTRRSHVKGRNLPAEDAIRSQLHMSKRELRCAVACTLDLAGYLNLLKEKGVL